MRRNFLRELYYAYTRTKALYIKLVVLKHSIGNVSPYEKLYGVPPNNTHLRSFGCLCFASTLKQGWTKFNARATPCVFVGYPYDQKGYKLYDLASKKIFVSQNVRFHEHHLPYHIKSLPDSPFKLCLPTTTDHPFLYDEPIFPSPSISDPPSSNPSPTDLPPSSSIPAASDALFYSPSPSLPEVPTAPLPPHKSGRISKQPTYISDYVCNVFSSHACSFVSLPSPDITLIEPFTYKHAATDPHCLLAIQQELAALEQNHTWDMVPLPPGSRLLVANGFINSNSRLMGLLKDTKLV